MFCGCKHKLFGNCFGDIWYVLDALLVDTLSLVGLYMKEALMLRGLASRRILKLDLINYNLLPRFRKVTIITNSSVREDFW